MAYIASTLSGFNLSAPCAFCSAGSNFPSLKCFPPCCNNCFSISLAGTEAFSGVVNTILLQLATKKMIVMIHVNLIIIILLYIYKGVFLSIRVWFLNEKACQYSNTICSGWNVPNRYCIRAHPTGPGKRGRVFIINRPGLPGGRLWFS